LKLRKEDDLVLLQETKDNLGFTRQFYEQRYKGIKVHHGLYGVHSRDGKIEYIGGEYKKVKNVIVVPSLSEKQALQKALDYIHASKYKWENQNEEKFIKFFKSDSAATYYPKGELLICKDVLKTDSIYRLSYVFDIFSESPFSHKRYYVDAITGDMLNMDDLIFDSNTTGTAATRYSGSQSITTDSYTNGYRLRETRNGVRVETYNMNRTTNYVNTDFSDNDNNWTATEYNNTNFDNAALDAHWGLEHVYDYWNTVMLRNSLDNQGVPLLNYVHANLVDMGYSSNDNAFWDGQRMTFGDGQYTMNPVVALDIVAHETGHGIMTYTAGFGISGENGALNEGFSDIWGAVIENWVTPNNTNNWLIGEQIMKDGTYLRSLSNPKSKNNPDTYHGTYWDSNGEVHKNSTVMSHWFYLLSQGGSGTNDLNNSYSVYGIGIDIAAKIVYQAQNVELRNYPTAQYIDVMTQTIRAATDIYGVNSFEVMQVQNAWYAVGLGTLPTQISLSGPSTLCTTGTYTISNLPAGVTVQWNVSNNLQIVSSAGSSVILQSIGAGAGWIEAVITIFGNNITLPRYNIQVSPAYALYADSYPNDCDEIVLKADVPDNTVITWTASPNILIDGYQSPYTKQGNTVSVYSTNNQEGSIQGLTASGCLVNEFIFTPCLDWSFTSNCEWTSPAPGEPLIASCSPAYSDAMKYEWYIHTQYLTSTDEPDLHTIEWPCIEGDLNVRAITPSGATQLTSACSFFPLCYSYSYFTLSPNPASSGSVMVNLDETNLSKKQNTEKTVIESQNKTYEIQLWNSFGLIKIVRTDMKKYQLDLNGITAGFYYVLVVKDGKTYRKQLIIK